MAFDEWRESNPLRAWRRSQRPLLSHAALSYEMTRRGYRITPITLSRWESGEYDPPERAMAVLVEITGVRDLPAQWAKWQKGRGRAPS
jgi:hypothetical protein